MSANEIIKETFCKLLEKKPYDKITVSEICQKSHVSSKTFYKHYDGKQGLVRALMYDDWAGPIKQVREVLPLDRIRSATQLMIEQSFERIWKKRAVYRNLFSHYGRTELADDITAVLAPLNRHVYKRYNFTEEEYEFVTQLFSSFHIPLIHWWLTKREDIPPERMARYFNTWCFGHWRDIDENEQGQTEKAATSPSVRS